MERQVQMQQEIEKDSEIRNGNCEVCMRTDQQVVRYFMAKRWRQVCVDAWSCVSIYKASHK
jgi:hypothetical protein